MALPAAALSLAALLLGAKKVSDNKDQVRVYSQEEYNRLLNLNSALQLSANQLTDRDALLTQLETELTDADPTTDAYDELLQLKQDLLNAIANQGEDFLSRIPNYDDSALSDIGSEFAAVPESSLGGSGAYLAGGSVPNSIMRIGGMRFSPIGEVVDISASSNIYQAVEDGRLNTKFNANALNTIRSEAVEGVTPNLGTQYQTVALMNNGADALYPFIIRLRQDTNSNADARARRVIQISFGGSNELYLKPFSSLTSWSCTLLFEPFDWIFSSAGRSPKAKWRVWASNNSSSISIIHQEDVQRYRPGIFSNVLFDDVHLIDSFEIYDDADDLPALTNTYLISAASAMTAGNLNSTAVETLVNNRRALARVPLANLVLMRNYLTTSTGRTWAASINVHTVNDDTQRHFAYATEGAGIYYLPTISDADNATIIYQ
jgi:hypothetical protein